MPSRTLAKNVLKSEITNILKSGFFLLVHDREYFVPFDTYPTFLNATIEQIHNFKEVSPGFFHWPRLDVDIELEALEHPERFPLIFR
jgi:hypothetical protein